MSCELCNADKELIIYEDNVARILYSNHPIVNGHLIVIPKQHFSKIEEMPDEIVSYIFLIGNKTSTAIFETLKCQGTNIVVNNGKSAGQKTEHFTINVIPRFENDGIDFKWKTKQINPVELDEISKKIKEKADLIGVEVPEEKYEEHERKTIKESYNIKHLNRIP